MTGVLPELISYLKVFHKSGELLACDERRKREKMKEVFVLLILRKSGFSDCYSVQSGGMFYFCFVFWVVLCESGYPKMTEKGRELWRRVDRESQMPLFLRYLNFKMQFETHSTILSCSTENALKPKIRAFVTNFIIFVRHLFWTVFSNPSNFRFGGFYIFLCGVHRLEASFNNRAQIYRLVVDFKSRS